MVVKERKGYWAPRRLFRYVCVGCGNRLDEGPIIRTVRGLSESKKPRGDEGIA